MKHYLELGQYNRHVCMYVPQSIMLTCLLSMGPKIGDVVDCLMPCGYNEEVPYFIEASILIRYSTYKTTQLRRIHITAHLQRVTRLKCSFAGEFHNDGRKLCDVE